MKRGEILPRLRRVVVRGASRQIIVFNEQNIEWVAASKRTRSVFDLGPVIATCERYLMAKRDSRKH
jgi:hypothetical protein